MRPIVLVAHARSGSNCLVEILNLALPTPLLNEPFNERFTTWSPGNQDYRARLVDEQALDAVVDEIASTWSGFKLLSYQLELPLLEHLLLRPDVRVVRLRRRNLLETAVSNLIALQTELWKTWDADGRLEDHYRDLAPIPIEDVRETLRWTQVRLDEVDEVLDRRTGPTLRVAYEDLYLHDTEASLAQLWCFLEAPPLTSARVAHYLDPAAVQMAGPTTYGRLPNIEEIERSLGSDATGHLTYL